MSSLTGRLALVTGGGSGIGKAVCETFAREGARVIVADVNEESANKTLDVLQGTGHSAIAVDVSDRVSVSHLFARIQEKYLQGPDTIVNCAGILKQCPFLETSESEFDALFSINVKGSFMISKEAAKIMIHNKCPKGCIINMASVYAKSGSPNLSAYCATKAAIVSLTKSIALELCGSNIRCNAIAPGFINTPMSTGGSEAKVTRFIQSIPMKRMGEPSEIAEVALFLASDKSSYITGEIVEVTGGLLM